MIRVGFVLEVSDWLGGINYYRSLFSAVRLVPNREVELVLFVGPQVDSTVLENFGSVRVVRSSILEARSPLGFLRRIVRKILRQHDPILEILLRSHGVQVLSHYSGALSPRSSIKTVGWIPDFQFIHLPALFSENDISMRIAAVRCLLDHCTRVIVSSKNASEDLGNFDPAALEKSRVMHFVPEMDTFNAVATLAILEEKYNFRSPYFYLPNQFWAHKNHVIVIEALKELRESGVQATVIATGKTQDHRHSGHFELLMAKVSELGLMESFRVLGVVPYRDLVSLMHHSLAVINPSLFEGWSTTVEESKALNKTILLSNIPVHREQNPAAGLFFDPTNAKELAQLMEKTQRCHRENGEGNGDLVFSEEYTRSRIEFGNRYQEIVLDLFN